MKTKNEEYEALKKKALAQLKTGQPLLGKDGAFAPPDSRSFAGKA